MGCFPVLLISFVLGSILGFVDLWSGSLWLFICYILIKKPSRWELMGIDPRNSSFFSLLVFKDGFSKMSECGKDIKRVIFYEHSKTVDII